MHFIYNIIIIRQIYFSSKKKHKGKLLYFTFIPHPFVLLFTENQIFLFFLSNFGLQLTKTEKNITFD